MTAVHEFICNRCDQKAKAIYNREHWLPPVGWSEVRDAHDQSDLIGHLCGDCTKYLLPEEGCVPDTTANKGET